MLENARELRAKRAALLMKLEQLNNRAAAEQREFNSVEQADWDSGMAEAERLTRSINLAETLPGELGKRRNGTPAILHFGRGDTEVRAMAAYIRTGDRGAIDGIAEQDEGGFHAVVQLPRGEMRAVDQAMTLTEADGGAAVPTGFSGQVAARRNEVRISDRLRLRNVPGSGTTVNFPYESADPAVLATTAEQDDAHAQNYERDRPTFANKPFTLVKKTKKLELTEELLDDEDANLMRFVADHIGRAIGLTHNAMLLTEVAANGTALKTFASATVIAAGEPEDLVYHDTLSHYLDDGGAAGWVMRPSVFGEVKKITGNSRMYEGQNFGSSGKDLLEYPVVFSNSAGATQASAKSLYFGNWYYVGMREDPALRLIRDPYTVDGMVILKYSFRSVYGVLIAGAIGYGSHPSA